MASWQRNEPLQVGPAGRSSNPDAVMGGQDFRDFIYSWPLSLNNCGIETAALNGSSVNSATSIDVAGLGAAEYLLYTTTVPSDCTDKPTNAQRMAHLERVAERIEIVGTALAGRWEASGGNFTEQWSKAGDGSIIYSNPQEALDALSIALFYVEKSTKDRKIAFTTGIGATGLECSNPTSCPEDLESPLSSLSGANIKANVQLFRDAFTGIGDGMGVNDLLKGIDRSDVADDIVEQLDLVLQAIDAIEAGDGFDQGVRNISDKTECTNASANSSGLAVCALHGRIKTAMDTFRGPVVSALGLAVPASAAGDND